MKSVNINYIDQVIMKRRRVMKQRVMKRRVRYYYKTSEP
jgi:hypothetical protein